MTVNVLLVEDDVFLAETLADAIEEEFGWHVEPRHSLKAALARADVLPAFAVLDIDLGDGKVYPFADRLVEACVAFMFLSGARPKDLPLRFQDVPFMSKPCNETVLFKVMQERINA